ncbi:MAG: hypothetical protein IJL06_05960 [Kiritimatiellae bacterium]|nr:hypothetical protein [Kiritimatiellia bacterium]
MNPETDKLAKTCCSMEWSRAEKSVEVRACAGGLRVLCAETVSKDAAGFANVCGLGFLVPWSEVVDLCAALLGYEGDVYDKRAGDGLATLRLRVHKGALGVFVGVSIQWDGRADADSFRAISLLVPSDVASELARFSADRVPDAA